MVAEVKVLPVPGGPKTHLTFVNPSFYLLVILIHYIYLESKSLVAVERSAPPTVATCSNWASWELRTDWADSRSTLVHTGSHLNLAGIFQCV